MADEDKAPRRYKLPSEHSDNDRAAAQRFGGSGSRSERDEYIEWRDRMLAEEHDDLALRGRLLREQAEVLRTWAADTEMNALEAVTAEDFDRHLRAVQDAWEKGTDRPQPPGGTSTAAEWEGQADQLEAEADEIAQHLAEEAA